MDPLIEQLRRRLAAGDGRQQEAEIGPLVEAAFAGDEAVSTVLDGGQAAGGPRAPGPSRPARAYLASIGVEGFRGIGRRAELQLEPGPGLTVVAGRNGSGKSSFAEGLEMLLTGDNLRWAGRSAIWRDGWRNLHHTTDPALDAELYLEGHAEQATLRRWWEAGADLDQSQTGLDLPGVAACSLDWLGWDAPLENYRPFLSYNELGSMLTDKPSSVHDAMSAFLGLDEGVEATEVLRQRRLALQKPAKELGAATRRLANQLQNTDDERAAAALTLLVGRSPDVDQLAALAAGTTPDGDSLAPVRALAQLELPAPDLLEQAATDLQTALDVAAGAAGTDAGHAKRLAGLLRGAREHWLHDRSVTACPVCGTPDVLSDGWAARLDTELASAEARAATATATAERLAKAHNAALAALRPVPDPLRNGTGVDGAPEAAAAWLVWAEAPASGVELASRLRSFGPVADLADRARRAAGDVIDRHDLSWRPHAQAIAGWLEQARLAEEATARSKRVKAAEDWLRAALGEIRNERFEPISVQARELWDILRHRSNVQLEQVALEGQSTNRRVSLEVTVDGAPAAALGVMSQGELHALALSLFLPRATMEASPFRFVVIDDPVQAMDPARVDGLARVLEQVAKERQVIVFTHDQRLPEAIRRLGIAAEHLEVTRQAGSVVSTRPVWDPVDTALDDARAIARTATMTVEARRKVVPSFCRLALEAAAIAVVRRRRLGRGDSHESVDQLFRAAKPNLRQMMALALFDDPERKDVNEELDQRYSPEGARILADCNAGSHGNFTGDPTALVAGAARLARWVRALP